MLQVVTSRTEDSSISSTLCSLGMSPYGCPPPVPFKDCYSVILNGRMLGYIPKDQASHLVSRIRHLKATSTSQVRNVKYCSSTASIFKIIDALIFLL